jgi:amino acid permease
MDCPVLFIAVHRPPPSSSILWWSDDFEAVLVAFPIITLSFLSIFNVLPIQNALLRPTRRRMLLVIDGAMLSCFVLTLIFGLAGYLYAGDRTDGNILNNCDSSNDAFLLVGQVGCGVTLMLAMPMMLLPCRSSLLEVVDVFVYGPHRVPVEDELDGPFANGENHPLVEGQEQTRNNRNYGTKTPSMDPEKASTAVPKKGHIMDNVVVHYVSTLLIVVTCYIAAVRIPSVATVWSIIGCFMGYLIAFVLPCTCYLEIQKRYPGHARESSAWIWFSYALLAFSILISVACTTETIMRVL